MDKVFENQWNIRLAIIALFLAAVVVILGAFTRLVDAGLGCPDWPTCYGHLWIPSSSADIAIANQIFADTPVDSQKTWPEQIHRIFASTLGLVILTLFFVNFIDQIKSIGQHTQAAASDDFSVQIVLMLLSCLIIATVMRATLIKNFYMDVFLLTLLSAYGFLMLRMRALNWGTHNHHVNLSFYLIALLAGLVILQGLFGMWTVTLKLWPQVVTAHLLGGFIIVSLLAVTIVHLAMKNQKMPPLKRLALIKVTSLIALVFVFIQIFLGGWVSSNYAALACPDFPLCQNQVWPQANFTEGFNLLQHIGPNYLGGQMDNDGRIAIHLLHRVGAIFVSISVLLFSAVLLSEKGNYKIMGVCLLFLLLLQLSLGITNVIKQLPLSIAVAHNAVAAVLLASLCVVRYFILKSENSFQKIK